MTKKTTKNDDMKYDETDMFARGQLYMEYGTLLCNPETTLEDLVRFGLKHNLDLQFRMAQLEGEQHDADV